MTTSTLHGTFSVDPDAGAQLGRRTILTRWTHDELRVVSDNAPIATSERPVVAVPVTSEQGVVVGGRRDGMPPSTFIDGRVEPGETPTDAAEREAAEETGLQVSAEAEIGRRIRPDAGRAAI